MGTHPALAALAQMDHTSARFVIELLVRGAVLLAAARLIVWCLPRTPAALRHGTWAAALLAVLVQPMLSRLLAPHAHVPALFSERAPAVALAAARHADLAPQRAASVLPAGRGAGAADRPAASGTAATAIVVLWLAGAGVLTIRWGAGLAVQRGRIMRAGLVREERTRRMFERLVRSTGNTRVQLLTSTEVAQPFAWAFGRMAIVLPAHACTWPARRLHAVLCHELAHLERRDAWSVALGHLVRAIHWPDPMVWSTVRALELSREQACDDAVLRSGTRASEYATHLLALALPGASARTSFARRPTVERRIGAVLDARRPRRNTSGVHRAALATGFGILALASASLHVWSDASAASPARAAEGLPRTHVMLWPDTDSPDRDSRPSDRDRIERLPTRDVIAVLDAPDPRHRRLAAHTLGDRRDPATLPALAAHLHDEDRSVRRKILWAIGETGPARPAHRGAVDAVTRTALDPDEDVRVRRMAVRALGLLGLAESGPHLVDLLGASQAGVRAQAADALGDLNYRPGIGALRRAVTDHDRNVRRNARTSLRRLDR